MINLWSTNQPRSFWQCQPDLSDEIWNEAIRLALPGLGLPDAPEDIDSLLEVTLGEGQFGPGHWTLSRARRVYYFLKPLLPRYLTRFLRQSIQQGQKRDFELSWPIEDRYPRFQFNVLDNLLELTGQHCVQYCPLWPEGKSFALVLTHDIECNEGQKSVSRIADLEESLGFHSSFNFVPEGYPVDMGLVKELRQRGFEIGIHGLRHDGKLFDSKAKYLCCAEKINHYLDEFDAVGFRAPLTIRNPEWLQALNIEYDLSFFDTDPFEPIPGGTMSIWPFFIGHFIELPYTLVQDYTLTAVLGESTPRLWLEKVDFIEKYHGMALVNSHPDYLKSPSTLKIYSDFLTAMKCRSGFWHALPREIAQWWKNRAASGELALYEKVLTNTDISTMDGELIRG
jgi:peptidoglycan/xylan/chitin deacetylase (PgdA/CDA1 family)